MFCAHRLVFGGTEGVGSRSPALRVGASPRRYRGRQVPFLYFARPYSFPAVPREPVPIIMFCAPRLVFDCTGGVGSRFHILRSQTRFRRYRDRRGTFSCFARLDSFSAVPRALGPLFIFCAPGLVLGGTEGVGSRFHVLRARTHFRCYGGRRFPFSRFACSD
jgi:hypothetical protein